MFPHENDWSDMLEDNTTAVSLQDEQFQFGDLVVQLQENEVIALLSGERFKSYKSK